MVCYAQHRKHMHAMQYNVYDTCAPAAAMHDGLLLAKGPPWDIRARTKRLNITGTAWRCAHWNNGEFRTYVKYDGCREKGNKYFCAKVLEGLSDSAYLNYAKKSGSQLLPQNTPNMHNFRKSH